jgi:hypothetical protein
MKPGLIAVLVCLASSAIAAEDVMSTRYGNTTVAVDIHGAESRTWYDADHTFASIQGSLQLKGTWSLAGKYAVPALRRRAARRPKSVLLRR